MLILVTGASGYVASHLIPQLLARGHQVRALARSPQKLAARAWANQVDIIQGDVMRADSLLPAMHGVDSVYYLVHNMSSGHGYTNLEIESARNTAQAAEAAGVKHIIYLGGLADPEQHIAPHMRSRIETGVTLRAGRVPVTEFRAGVVVGSGSISFEMMRFMTELLPVIPAPVWVKNRSQPIAIQNVVDYLLYALENPAGRGQVWEVGGREITAYKDMMLTYARLRGLKRRFLLLPYVPVEFMAFGISLTTPVPRAIARALVGGLSRDSVVVHHNAQEAYPINLINFEVAAREALSRLHPRKIEQTWRGELRGLNPFKHEGFFIAQREVKRKEIPAGFEVEADDEAGLLLRAAPSRLGQGWLEYKTDCAAGSTRLMCASYFAPHGWLGFLYGLWQVNRFPKSNLTRRAPF